MRKWFAIVIACLVCAAGSPQPFAVTTALMPPPFTQFLDNSGKPLSGGFVFTYQAGTSTPQTTYTDSTGTVANSNPITLDAGGFPSSGGNRVGVWLQSGLSYKIVVQNFAGVQQWAADNVVEFLGSSVAGGATTQVQYNCSGSFCGNAGFTFTSGTQTANLVALNLTSGGTFAGNIGGGATFTGAVVFSGNPSFTGSPAFSTGTPAFNNGANMGTGTWSGANTFSGNKIFSGTPTFQTTSTFTGVATFAAAPVFNGGGTFNTTSPTAPTPAASDNSTKVATTAYVQGGFTNGSGWRKFPDGFIIEYGVSGADTPASCSVIDAVSVTWPTAFPNAVFGAVASDRGSGDNTCAIGSLTLSGATVWVQCGKNSPAGQPISCSFVAYGN